MFTTVDTNKHIVAKLVDDLIIAFESVSSSVDSSRSYFKLALGIATKTLGIEKAAIFHRRDNTSWKTILAVKVQDRVKTKEGSRISKFSEVTEVDLENNLDLEVFVGIKYSDIDVGETFDSDLIDGYSNITIIPFFSSGSQYCLAFFNKDKAVGSSGDVYYLQQHYKIFKGLFEFASAGTASLFTLWKESLFAGSRSSILERANDFIKSFADNTNFNSFDFILATGVDAATQLKILPHKQTTVVSHNAFDRLAVSVETPPYTKLALLRRDIWLQSQDGLICKETISKVSESLGEKYLGFELTEFYRSVPEFENSILGPDISKDLAEFLFKYYFKIEQIKTHLFLIYHLASSQEDVVDSIQIEEMDRFYNGVVDDAGIRDNLKLLLQSYLQFWSKSSGLSPVITSEWLFLWFGLKMLTSVNLFKDISEKYPPDFRAKFYQHFSCYYLYLLFLIRCLGEPSLFRFSDVSGGFEAFICASLFLMAEYTHQEEGLDVTVPLHSALQNIWSKEAILYTVRDGYRDHFHHVWNVCLLGLVLIEAGLFARLDPEWSSYSKAHIRKIRRNWLLAGLLHDIGYCLDLNRHLLSHLEIFSKVPSISGFARKLAEFFDLAEKELCASMAHYFTFYNGRKLDHGVTSSISIHYLDRLDATVMSESPSKEWIEEIAIASEAIAKHNLKKVVIKPQESPMAFLLLLCDHLQEWDRPRLAGDKLRRSFSVQFHRPRQGQSAGHDIVRYLKNNLKWEGDSIRMSGDTLCLTLVYKDASREKFEPAMIWCQNSEDFQRLDLEDFPKNFCIKFSLIHPICDKITRLNRTEMQLFEDFCRQDDTRLNLVQWCQSSRNSKANYFYMRPISETVESYSWKFCKTSSSGKIGYVPPSLYKIFTEWKERTVRKLQIVNANIVK